MSTHHGVRRGSELKTLQARHVMGVRVGVGVRVDGRRGRWREALVERAGDADPDARVVHVVLHRRVHRVVVLRCSCNSQKRRGASGT